MKLYETNETYAFLMCKHNVLLKMSVLNPENTTRFKKTYDDIANEAQLALDITRNLMIVPCATLSFLLPPCSVPDSLPELQYGITRQMISKARGFHGFCIGIDSDSISCAFRLIVNGSEYYENGHLKSCCEIFEDHHILLKNDPNRLSTDFLKKITCINPATCKPVCDKCGKPIDGSRLSHYCKSCKSEYMKYRSTWNFGSAKLFERFGKKHKNLKYCSAKWWKQQEQDYLEFLKKNAVLYRKWSIKYT